MPRARKTELSPFGLAFRAELEARGINRSQLARRLDLSLSNLDRWERGAAKISAEALTMLAEGIGCSIVDLWPDAARAVAEPTYPGWLAFRARHKITRREAQIMGAIRWGPGYSPAPSQYESLLIGLRAGMPGEAAQHSAGAMEAGSREADAEGLANHDPDDWNRVDHPSVRDPDAQ